MTAPPPARLVADIRAGDGLLPGAVEARFDGDQLQGLAFRCPCGCGSEGWLNTVPVGPDSGWKFTGTVDAPTLHPSVFNTGMPCRWHGWLRNGEWVSC